MYPPFTRHLPAIHPQFTCHSPSIHPPFTHNSPAIHPPCTHHSLAIHPPVTPFTPIHPPFPISLHMYTHPFLFVQQQYAWRWGWGTLRSAASCAYCLTRRLLCTSCLCLWPNFYSSFPSFLHIQCFILVSHFSRSSVFLVLLMRERERERAVLCFVTRRCPI